MHRFAVLSSLSAIIVSFSPHAPVAQAALPTLVFCGPGSGSSEFTPGLTTTPRPTEITGSGDLGPCVGDDRITGATFTFHATSPAFSCTAGDAEGTIEITWAPVGETSTVDYVVNRSVRPDDQMVSITKGTISQGRYAGAAFTGESVIVPPLPGACLVEPGVPNAVGSGSAVVIQ
ncbi:hypothetical protein [Saccharothrix yanglingensis]|uniref:Ig-like domain-containing protein n=1 Tax=Saccharothrix yanglingensis TaxID=659496 RepID=A0ABU0X0H3_9PSEU|nr:hypothetical protein [Saccharothrix yanglingensis]MDQ2585243.1 hypothetical protein [Saccharothrix yanglingensis]